MVLSLILKGYSKNGNVPTQPLSQFQGIIVKHPKRSQGGGNFKSFICDCGSSGCCSY